MLVTLYWSDSATVEREMIAAVTRPKPTARRMSCKVLPSANEQVGCLRPTSSESGVAHTRTVAQE